MKDKTLEMIEKLNNHLHASNIYLPVLEGFEIEHKVEIPNCIFIAKNNNGIIEQLFIDPSLKENESLEERIKKIQTETTNYIKTNNFETFIKHYKDYDNGIFSFKIYIRDIILNNSLIRELDTYFVDNKYNDVYKLTLSYGPFNKENNLELLSNNNGNDDLVTKKIANMLNVILENTKYNNENNV